MGSMTRSTLVSEALLTVGNTSITARVNASLNSWLRKTYAAWAWPFLTRKVKGISLAAGVQSLVVGGGLGGITPSVRRIMDPIWLYNSTWSTSQRARIRSWTGDGSDSNRPDTHNPALNVGTPSSFAALMDTGTWGQWTLTPDVVPDKTYLLSIDYYLQPDDIPLDASGDATIPLYPNDDTIMQACIAYGFRYDNEMERYQMELGILGSKVAEDRVNYSAENGINDVVELDATVFRRG